MNSRRLAAIRDIVQRQAVHSQEQLRRLLRARGFSVAQATLSRDIKALGLVKGAADGAYHTGGSREAPTESDRAVLARTVAEYALSVDSAAGLVVLKTGPGQAQLLALAVDRARPDDVLGTIAGDDTILVICRHARAAAALVAAVTAWMTEA